MFLFTASGLAVNANPFHFHRGIKAKQIQQQVRIKQGVITGKLTRKEVLRLEAEQAKMYAVKRVARADGFISPVERAFIKCEQAKASKNIYVQKHDYQYRW